MFHYLSDAILYIKKQNYPCISLGEDENGYGYKYFTTDCYVLAVAHC
jgi:hypothetical protein